MIGKPKPEMVDLQVNRSDVGGKDKVGTELRPYTIKQANEILRIENKLGKIRHSLPEKSPYQLNKQGELVLKAKEEKITEKKEPSTKSDSKESNGEIVKKSSK